MSKPLGIGVIGLAVGAAALAINDEDGAIRVIGVCDSDTNLAQRASKNHGIPFVTSDAMDLIALPGVGAVAVFSQPRDHFDQCMSALMSGKHVVCAAPLADSADQARELAREAELRNLRLVVGYAGVGRPEIEAAVALAENGDLGEIVMVEVNFEDSGDSTGLSAPVNLLLRLGGEIAEVYAIGHCEPADATLVATRFTTGTIGRITMTTREDPAPIQISLHGTHGRVVGSQVTLDRVAGRPVMTFAADGVGEAEPLRWIRSLEREVAGTAMVDAWAAVRVAAICDAVHESLRSNAPVRVSYPAP